MYGLIVNILPGYRAAQAKGGWSLCRVYVKTATKIICLHTRTHIKAFVAVNLQDLELLLLGAILISGHQPPTPITQRKDYWECWLGLFVLYTCMTGWKLHQSTFDTSPEAGCTCLLQDTQPLELNNIVHGFAGSLMNMETWSHWFALQHGVCTYFFVLHLSDRPSYGIFQGLVYLWMSSIMYV